jgi:20S proteasome alpha/beta subunit
MIAKRVAGYVSAFTLYSSVRPFGLATVLGCVDAQGPAIFMIEPSGLYYVSYIVDGYIAARRILFIASIK